MEKCKICNKECANNNGLATHITHFHKIKIKEYYDLYLKKENEGICIECNKFTKYRGLKEGYAKYCSSLCASKSNIRLNNIKYTNMERYGVENVFSTNEVKDKIKISNLKKYGVENVMYLDETKDKIKNTCLKKYNTEHPLQNKKIQKKYKETIIKHYGVENPRQADEIQNKIKETNLKRYGVEATVQLDFVREKLKEYNLRNYGVEYYSQSDEWKQKHFNEWLSEYNVKLNNNNLCYIDSDTYDIKLKCLKCNNIFTYARCTVNLYIKNNTILCPFCNPRLKCISTAEKELVDYIKTIYQGEIIENDHNILDKQELDIYLPELKLAFEYNGLYFHNSNFKDINYHLNKTMECEKQGIQLVHIFENEWTEKQNEIKEYIKNLINSNNDILNNEIIIKKIENKIIVNRRFSNGKILEKEGYILTEIKEPILNEILFEGKVYKVYDCGSLIYGKM